MTEYTIQQRAAVEILSHAVSHLLRQEPKSNFLRDGDDTQAAFSCMDLRRVVCLEAAEGSDTQTSLLADLAQLDASYRKTIPIEQWVAASDNRSAAARLYDSMRANWSNVCASEVFQGLKRGRYRGVLHRLANGDISVGKAAESIAELAHSGHTQLPDITAADPQDDMLSWKDRCTRSETERDAFKEALTGLIYQLNGARVHYYGDHKGREITVDETQVRKLNSLLWPEQAKDKAETAGQ